MDLHGPLYSQIFPSAPTKGERKKLALLEEAIGQIAKNGLENVSLDSVGKALGMRRSHVVYYFPVLADLILAAAQLVTTTAQDLIVRRFQKAKTSKQRLLALLDANFDWIEEYPGHQAILLVFWSGCLRDPKLQSLHATILLYGQERLKAILGPSLKSQEDLDLAAKDIQAWMTGALTNLALTGGGAVSNGARKQTREALLVLYRRYCKDS